MNRTHRVLDTPCTGPTVYRTHCVQDTVYRTHRVQDPPRTGHTVYRTHCVQDTPCTARRVQDTSCTGHTVYSTTCTVNFYVKLINFANIVRLRNIYSVSNVWSYIYEGVFGLNASVDVRTSEVREEIKRIFVVILKILCAIKIYDIIKLLVCI